MVQITDEQVYQEYFRRLNVEFNESKDFINSICLKIEGDIHSKFTIKDNCPNDYQFFSDKYRWTACAQLKKDEKLFIKSAIETNNLCNKFDDFLDSKLS